MFRVFCLQEKDWQATTAEDLHTTATTVTIKWWTWSITADRIIEEDGHKQDCGVFDSVCSTSRVKRNFLDVWGRPSGGHTAGHLSV